MPSREQVERWRADSEHRRVWDAAAGVPAMADMLERAAELLALWIDADGWSEEPVGKLGVDTSSWLREWRGEAAGVLDPSVGSSLLDAAGR